MGNKSRTQTKKFDCGHRGYGQYCHVCADIKSGILIKTEQKELKMKVKSKMKSP